MKDSEECSTSPLEWFDVMPTQTAIEKSSVVEYQSLTAIRGESTLEFLCPALTDEYWDVFNSRLYLKCKVQRNNDAVLDQDHIATPINDMLNSLFKNVELEANDRLLSHSNNTHGYTSMISHLLHDSEESSESERAMRMIFKDTAGQMDVIEPRKMNPNQLVPGVDIEEVAAAQAGGNVTYRTIPNDRVMGNNGLYKRHLLTKNSASVELLGPLRIDLFEQERYIPNGVSLKIRFHRQAHSFVLMAAENTYKVVIEDAQLLMRKVKPSPGVQLGHHDAMLKMPAKFPITRKECKVHSIATGLRDVKKDNLFLGQLPKRVAIAMVESDAFAGNVAKNPFNFKPFDSRHVQLYVDGEPARSQPLKLVAGDGQYIHGFDTLFRGLSRLDGEKSSIIKRKDWSRGYALYVFDLTQDLDADDHYPLIKHGNLRLEVEFGTALPEPINILVYAEFDNIVEITAERNVQIDYV